MFCWRWSARTRPAPLLFKCPLIHEEECLWNVKGRSGPVFSAFFSLFWPRRAEHSVCYPVHHTVQGGKKQASGNKGCQAATPYLARGSSQGSQCSANEKPDYL